MSARRSVRRVLVSVLTVLWVPVAAAQSAPTARPEPPVPEKAGKILRAFRVREPHRPPRVDGLLDDAIWALAPAIDELTQNEPQNMAPASERTMIQVAYDDRYLYVAAYCYDREPSLIGTGLGRRDNAPPSDRIILSIDPQHDHLTAYIFELNPAGVQRDYTFYDDTRSNNDYDGVWDAATRIAEDGWIAEFQIPFSQMRFDVPPESPTTWGFNVRRNIHRTGEFDRWVPTPRGAPGFVSRFGHLVFDDRLAPPRRVELQPFTLGRFEDRPEAALKSTADGGLDLRYGLGSAATLSATINPDFGQVEQDPAVLNLTVFETRFTEKRAFFQQDSPLFLLPYSLFTDFYSPRIGRAPGRFALMAGDRQLSRPDRTTILGAAKLTGKSGPWSYAGLSAVTAREFATVQVTDERGEVSTTRRLIEPRTSYNVGRLQRDILGGSSNVGFIGTAVLREKDFDGFTAGGDANIRWGSNRYAWNGHWTVTRTAVGGVARDGIGGVTNFTFSGKYLGVSGHFDHFSRHFANSDLGFFSTRANRIATDGSVTLRQPDPRGVFRSFSTTFSTDAAWTYDGLAVGRGIEQSASLLFVNFWSANATIGHDFERLDDLDTRGGPPIIRRSGQTFSGSVNSDSRKSWTLSLFLSRSRNAAGSRATTISPTLRLQPSARLQTTVSTSYTAAHDDAQWVANRDVNGDGRTDHVYGRLDRHVLSLTGRATYAFGRALTLEAYLQPFVATGDYTDLRRLTQPRSYEFEPATLPSNPDFKSASLRTNLVLRWEYQRGSTIYVVWQSARASRSNSGEFNAWHDLGGTFRGEGPNVLMVKMNYWLGL